MILQRDLKSFGGRFHRNGITSEPFYLVAFVYKGTPMRAVIFAGYGPLGTPNGRCAVLDPSDWRSCYRGDDFEPAIRQAILAYGDKAFNAPQSEAPTASPLASATTPRSKA